jgi:chromosomal replication initiation ATPase DnaA
VQAVATIARAGEQGEDLPTPSEAAPRQRLARRRAERAIELCDSLIDITSALFGIPSKELRQTGRPCLEVARIRQLAMYVAHVTLRLSMKEVGVGFGRDRTTVLHACHLIEDLRDDVEFDRMVVMTERIASAAFRNRLEMIR